MADLSPLAESPIQAPRIILAEDNDSLRAEIAKRARSLGYEVCETTNALALIQAIAKACFGEDPPSVKTIVVSDLTSSRSALDALRMLREHPSCPRLVFVAGANDFEFRKEALQLGAIAVLDKPLGPEALMAVVVDHFSLDCKG